MWILKSWKICTATCADFCGIKNVDGSVDNYVDNSLKMWITCVWYVDNFDMIVDKSEDNVDNLLRKVEKCG